MNANIFSIVRASLHDGPGVRTVVYLKGCNMRCEWCHNPEGLSSAPEILWRPDRCIGCGRCGKVCAEHHPLTERGYEYVREDCSACGRCAEVCPNEALTLCGVPRSAQSVFGEICADKPYFERTGGGITVSGGECLLNPDFVAELFALCRADGIGTAVETAANVPTESIEKVAVLTDLFMVDLKLADSEEHRRRTGSGNGRIVENLRWLGNNHGNVWVRIPLIPGIADTEENLAASAELISGFGSGIKRVALLKYNGLAGSKYAASGREFKRFGDDPQSDAELRKLEAFMRGRLPSGVGCGE